MYFPDKAFVLNLISEEATVGQLMGLCEENYRLLHTLAPDLAAMTGSHHSIVAGQKDLHMEILEQSAYTTLIHLTYYFEHEDQSHPDPDATIRVYHDARQTEVVTIRESALPVCNNYLPPGLQDKWRANNFIGKWLSYCRQHGHTFNVDEIVHL